MILYSMPVLRQESVLGFVSGGIRLNDRSYLRQLGNTINALPGIGHDRVPVPWLSVVGSPVDPLYEAGQILDHRSQSGQYKGILGQIEIGHSMSRKTIAEFVENEHILRELHALGVDYVQGFWYSASPSPRRSDTIGG